MVTSNRLRESVVLAKQQLTAGRESIQRQHEAGSLGVQVCRRLSDLFDAVILDIFDAALADSNFDSLSGSLNFAIVPHGGYGRRHMSPFSDVDLMLLHHPRVRSNAEGLARRLVEDISDLGLDLGFSLRTPQQAVTLALQDPVILTSLLESRFLAGSVGLYTQYFRHLKRTLYRRRKTVSTKIWDARKQERMKFGDSVYLLEPNVKRSTGTLRGIHLLRWLGFVHLGESRPQAIAATGALDTEDYERIRDAQEFLLRVRNEMHFGAGTAQDMMYRSEQVRLADALGFEGTETRLPVEQLMQQYFEHTSNVRNIVAHFAADVTSRSNWYLELLSWVSYREGNYRIGLQEIEATREGTKQLRGNLDEVLHLMSLANQYNKRIGHRTWRAIRESMMSTEEIEVTDSAAAHFMELLSGTARLGNLLRRLHELRVLEKLIPGFTHARHLLQFNEYHKYTVDEHCIRSVDRATDFATDKGSVGIEYRKIKNPQLLHLALLIHDLGKGFTEDHSEVGRRIAEDVGRKLKLSTTDTSTISFLVHRHLRLSHLAFRGDTSDENTMLKMAVEIGSPERLRMLYVLTCADFASVGPGVLNSWKIDVLTSVYFRLLEILSGEKPSANFEARVAPLRKALLEKVQNDPALPWYQDVIAALPQAYLMDGTSIEHIESDLARLANLPKSGAVAWGRYLPDREVIEYSIGGKHDVAPGIFYRLTGLLTSKRMNILSAEIHSLGDDIFLDRFYVEDRDFDGEPPGFRLDEISNGLVESLGEDYESPSFKATWQDAQRVESTRLTELPLKVRVDNSTSDKYTIIDVFTHDCVGLLYKIARVIFKLGLSVKIAKIGTYLDQVVDVFYVTDIAGKKIVESGRCEYIQNRITKAISSMHEKQAKKRQASVESK